MDPELLRIVRDPATSAEQLHALAASHPELGRLIAQHPNCYPDLRAWAKAYAPPLDTAAAPAASTSAGLGAGAKAALIVAGVVVLAGGGGALALGLSGGSLPGFGVSREQGGQNLADALIEYQAEAEQRAEDMIADMDFSGAFDSPDQFAELWGAVGSTAVADMRGISSKIGNAEVRDAYNDYMDVLDGSMDFTGLFTDDGTDYMDTLTDNMQAEAHALVRIGELCPTVNLDGYQYPQ